MHEFISHYSLIFFFVAGLCVLLIGVDKAGFGGGVGVLATPLMLLVVHSPLDAAGILLPLLCFCDLLAIWKYRKTYDLKNLRMLLPGCLIGILLASLFLWFFKAHADATKRALNVTIGAISVLFVIWQLGRGWLLKHLHPTRPKTWFGRFMGAVAGFLSTLAHAGGPPIVIFLLPQKLDPQRYVGTTVWFFAINNYIKLVPYYYLSMLHLKNLKTSLMLLPLVPVGVWLGFWLNKRMSQQTFHRVVYTLLFLVGLQLISGKSLMDLIRWIH